MIRLIFSDLRDHATTWIGAFAIAMTCGYIGGWAASIVATSATYPNIETLAFAVLLFSSVAAVAVLTSAANLTVSAQRRSYALWQLANVSPRLVCTVVLVQLAVVAVLGAICGTLLEAATFESLFPWVFSSPYYQPIDQVVPDAGMMLMPAVWLIVAAVFLIGGMRGALSAGKTSPMTALREPEPVRKGITWIRALLFAVLAIGTWQLASSFSGENLDSLQYSMFLPLLMVATLIPVAPVAFSLLLSGWTLLVPQNRWNAWYLARHTARHGLGISTSVETPIVVGFSLVAGIFSLGNLLEVYVRQQGLTDYSTSLDFTSAVLLLGGPILLSAVGAAVSVVMSSRSRTRDVALLTVGGAQPQTLLAAAGCETLIHVTTATLVGMGVVTASNALVASAVGLPLFEGLTFGEGLIVSLAGFILVLVATLIPTLSALNKETAAVLTVQE
ncbi:FtsX-like permease family protein [Eggerthella sp. YY7918]|uniref:FtsX-like permease family protein n=1 Tax=Eggerthella sp. (strain YY7918) TaxID=502558 RepID=UPI0002170FA1|nr:FtsX-like permease family protein [Eggerthella sp. YY7918]BAK43816.1 hypothetical protein EGYY_06050 [Eggerthella sp. YY7918]